MGYTITENFDFCRLVFDLRVRKVRHMIHEKCSVHILTVLFEILIGTPSFKKKKAEKVEILSHRNRRVNKRELTGSRSGTFSYDFFDF